MVYISTVVFKLTYKYKNKTKLSKLSSQNKVYIFKITYKSKNKKRYQNFQVKLKYIYFITTLNTKWTLKPFRTPKNCLIKLLHQPTFHRITLLLTMPMKSRIGPKLHPQSD